MRRRSGYSLFALGVLLGLGGCGGTDSAGAAGAAEQRRADNVVDDPPDPLAPLSSVAVPEPARLADFIQDRRAAIRLGKALFWDMQVGSDGIQACGACHFHAGADSRSKNQLNPGSPATATPAEAHFPLGGPNSQLLTVMYPFHQLADPDDAGSEVLLDVGNVTGSQGVFAGKFVDIVPGSPVEAGLPVADPVFRAGQATLRQVTPRNTPTVINAIFNHRAFWDGRAQNEFNGVNPFGDRDPNARVLYAGAGPGGGTLEERRIRLDNAALASLALGPPMSAVELSLAGRSFPKLGKKLLALRPLARQQVHPQDSVLGAGSRWPHAGLHSSYPDLIRAAFRPEWWRSHLIVKHGKGGRPVFLARPFHPLYTDEYSQMEYNFSLFFGLSIQMYLSTLVSDQAPLDRFLAGDPSALTAQQQQGMAIFQTTGQCINCHGGAELTNASVGHVGRNRIERMNALDGNCGIYDSGFNNTGVRPTREDLGIGGTDPFGNPLSEAILSTLGKAADPGFGGTVDPPLGGNPDCDARALTHGAFKVPNLRNVELTAPYFHNGGQLTLRQVVDFYNRGGDFSEANAADTDPHIKPLQLGEADKDALVAFLKALTDPRVRDARAPFDHPQIFVPNGHPGGHNPPSLGAEGRAPDQLVEIPAVGRLGGPVRPNFLNQ